MLRVAPFVMWGVHTALLASALAAGGTAPVPLLLALAALASGVATALAAAAAAERIQAAALLHAQAALDRAEEAQEQRTRQSGGWPCSLFYLMGMADAFLLVAEALALRRPLRQAARLRIRAWALLHRAEETAGGGRP